MQVWKPFSREEATGRATHLKFKFLNEKWTSTIPVVFTLVLNISCSVGWYSLAPNLSKSSKKLKKGRKKNGFIDRFVENRKGTFFFFVGKSGRRIETSLVPLIKRKKGGREGGEKSEKKTRRTIDLHVGRRHRHALITWWDAATEWRHTCIHVPRSRTSRRTFLPSDRLSLFRYLLFCRIVQLILVRSSETFLDAHVRPQPFHRG